MTDSDEGRGLDTDERYRRELDESVVGIVIVLCLADVAQGPSLNAEGGLTEDLDVGVLDFQPERRQHVCLVVLDRFEAPP
jgi:hypothetical protein